MALALVLALGIGLTLGLLGGGGSILAVPALVYAVGLDPKPAIATSLLVVAITSAAALVPHARAGHVRWRTGGVFGAAGMAGAFAGGRLARHLPGDLLLLLFAAMMAATALALWRGRPDAAAPTAPRVRTGATLVEGFFVGLATGLVGAGGGFLVVPALVLLGGLPMASAVGTSLLVIALKSAAGFAGYAAHVAVDGSLALSFSAAAVVGSIAGARLVPRIHPDRLRRGFAGFVLGMAVLVAWQERAAVADMDPRWALGGGALLLALLALARVFRARRMRTDPAEPTPPGGSMPRALALPLLLSVLVGSACGGAPGASSALPPEALQTLARSEEPPLILDVRSPAEFAAGHVPGAVNVPFDQVAERVAELAPGRERGIVVYCERGGRADQAAEALRAAGFEDVRELERHMAAWRDADLPLCSGSRPC